MRNNTENVSYDYLLLIISAILPVLYIAEVITVDVLHKILCIVFFALSSYTVLLEKYKLYILLLFAGTAISSYAGTSFPLILSLWLLSSVFSRRPYAVILGAGLAYIIMLKSKTLGLENSLAPCNFIILNIGLNYLELSLVLLGLVSIIAIAFTADVKHFEIGSLAQILALIVIIEAMLVVISWINVLTSVITVYGISIILFVRAIEKHRT
ncbi:MAG: hypothetical protein B6U75_01225 [Desulfurococcales archaeon ex4484_217_1]|nr:MAG: hypothetical protein B6U75_01225 [Desulfurococcales archaeon ex4484_217_1]